jgi:ankyrin repeat protein
MGVPERNYKNDISGPRYESGGIQWCDRIYVHSSRFAREVSHGVYESFGDREVEIERVNPKNSDVWLEANELSSKAQYEAQFKRWGFRKNLTKDTWHSIWHIMETRKAEGRTSAVYQRNRLIVDDKVKKETSRYRDCTSYGTICSTHTLPEDVEIRDSQTMQSGPTTGYEQLATTRLEFQELVAEIAAPIEEPTEPILRETRETSANRAAVIRDAHLAELLSTDMMVVDDLIELGDDHANLGNLISADFDLFFDQTFFSPEQHMDSIVGQSSSIHWILQDTISPLHPMTNLVLNQSRAWYSDWSTITGCISHTMSLLPLQNQHGLKNSTSDVVILKQILFLVMNNFAVEDHPAFTTLFQQIKHFSTAQLKYVLNAVPKPYSLALQQSFLTLAIKADAPSIVELLLDHGLQIGHLKSTKDDDPLTLACKLRRPEIVDILLQLGVDFSPVLGVIISKASLMERSPDEKSNFRHKIHQTLELVLKAGAKVNLDTLFRACFSQDTTILDLYIKFSQVPVVLDDDSSLLEHAFTNIMRVHDLDRVGFAIQRTLGENFQITQVKYEETRNLLQRVLQWASLKGNTRLVDFFLRRGLVPDTYCLCQAIRGDNEQLVRQFIRDGLDISETWDIPPTETFRPLRDPRPFAGVLPTGADPLLVKGVKVLYCRTSPLAEAVRWGREGFLRMFEEMGVWNKMHNQRQLDCLFFAAAETGNLELMKYLLDQSSEEIPVDCCTLAALGGYRDVIALLMDTNVRASESLVVTAVAVRDSELVRFILEVPNNSQMYMNALFFAARWADVGILKDLVRAGAYLDTYYWCCSEWTPHAFRQFERTSPLKEAIALGHLEAARFLLDSGADINEHDEYCFDNNENQIWTNLTPLSVAVKQHHESFVQELLNRGADPKDAIAFKFASSQSKSLFQILFDSFRQRYPHDGLDFASAALRKAIRDDDDTTTSLLGPYVSLNPRNQEQITRTYTGHGPTLFSEAVRSRNVNIIRTLLSFGGDPNSPTPFPINSRFKGRWTPFFDAITTEDVIVVKLLHEAGANLNSKAELGTLRTPLQLAVEKGNLQVINYLLENGADVNAAPCIRGGATAIQLAAIKGNVGLAERLIVDHGADFNAPACRFQGRTAFEGAAEHGRLDMLLMLYHKGVDLRSDNGTQLQRAMKFAEENGQVAAKALVEQIWQTVNIGVGSLPLLSFEDPSM